MATVTSQKTHLLRWSSLSCPHGLLARCGASLRSALHLGLFLSLLVCAGKAFADPQVASGLINSDQTYVVNDQGESLQEYGIGQLVYVVLDPKEKSKKNKDFYRVTFDPTNMKGDGWVQKDKVKLMTAYRSVDGKEPTEYERPAAPIAPRNSGTTMGGSVASSGPSEASSFLEELVKKDEGKSELKSITAGGNAAPAQPALKKGEKNPLENDLEFLFQEEGEFKKTFKETRAAVKDSMSKKVAISKFAAGSDAFANKVLDQFAAKLQKDMGQSNIQRLAFVNNIEDPKAITVAGDLDGVFYGQISPKIGDARLLKVKFYDKNLKQFTFEKVAKIPLADSTKTVETLAHDCYQFLSK